MARGTTASITSACPDLAALWRGVSSHELTEESSVLSRTQSSVMSVKIPSVPALFPEEKKTAALDDTSFFLGCPNTNAAASFPPSPPPSPPSAVVPGFVRITMPPSSRSRIAYSSTDDGSRRRSSEGESISAYRPYKLVYHTAKYQIHQFVDFLNTDYRLLELAEIRTTALDWKSAKQFTNSSPD
ncbi:hypothetical protein U9M48_001008 [Paspalum notatum var. saurae]|uniref:Uncharacterized protein n=1 Tax=Paspalum notatum var. saurae TaxID=547442 RepID=A0AAQ3PMK7_PASNO